MRTSALGDQAGLCEDSSIENLIVRDCMFMFSKKKRKHTQHEIFQTFSGMFQKLNEDSKENIFRVL
jgi:hypothetical protein